MSTAYQVKRSGPLPVEQGDILMVNAICLEPQFRGYGISLLALDRFVQHVTRTSPEWAKEGLLVLEPSGVADYKAGMDNHGEIQHKLIQYY